MISPKGEADNRPRRFYTEVDTAPLEEDKWGVRLDGKALRTPGKQLLAAPTAALADLLAREWREQDERIDFASMSATRLANVAIDRTPVVRAEMADEIARYAETDLVCHLADFPAELRARQESAWAPVREWAADTLGVRLVAVEGVIAARQPQESLDAARRAVLALPDFLLTALAHAVALFGSAVIGLAIVHRRISAVEGCEMSLVDELFQAEKWGVDAEAQQRLLRIRKEALMLDGWLDALERPDAS